MGVSGVCWSMTFRTGHSKGETYAGHQGRIFFKTRTYLPSVSCTLTREPQREDPKSKSPDTGGTESDLPLFSRQYSRKKNCNRHNKRRHLTVESANVAQDLKPAMTAELSEIKVDRYNAQICYYFSDNFSEQGTKIKLYLFVFCTQRFSLSVLFCSFKHTQSYTL